MIRDNKSAGSLVVCEVKTTTVPPYYPPLAYELQFAVSNFVKLDSGITSKSGTRKFYEISDVFLLDPYFVIEKANKIIYRSEVIFKTLDPCWKPFTIDLREIGKNK